MFFLPQRNQPLSMHIFSFLQTKLQYMFCSCFELFILVVLQQTMGLPSLMPIFAGNASVTNLREALGRFASGPLVAVLYLLVGSTGCGGNEQGFEEGISKLMYRAGEGIFFGNGFHHACLTLLAVSTVVVCVYRFPNGFHRVRVI